MSLWSCPLMLVKETSSTGFIWNSKLKHYPVWYIFMKFHSLITCIILPCFLFYLDCNVAWFLISGYLDNKFFFVTPLFPVKPICQTCPMLLVTIFNLLFFFYNIHNHWNWGVLFISKIKGFLGAVLYSWFIVGIF